MKTMPVWAMAVACHKPVESTSAPVRATPGSWQEAICRADFDQARALASGELEAGLPDEMERAFGEGPDLQRLGGWLQGATPEQQRWLTSGITAWGWSRGLKLNDGWPDPEVDPHGRALSSAKVAVPSEPFEVPLRVEADTGRTFVEVTLAGQPRWFLVDTGARVTTVSDALLQGAPVLAETKYDNAGQQGSGKYVEADLALGPLQLADTVVLMLPASAMNGMESGLAGILGWPILSRLRVELDFVSNKAIFGPPGQSDGHPELLVWDGYPMVRGELQGRPALLWLDTGAGRSQLFAGARQRGIELPAGSVERVRQQTLAGRITTERERVPGPIRWKIGETEAVLPGPVGLIAFPRESDWCFDSWVGLDLAQKGSLTLDATAGDLTLRLP